MGAVTSYTFNDVVDDRTISATFAPNWGGFWIGPGSSGHTAFHSGANVPVKFTVEHGDEAVTDLAATLTVTDMSGVVWYTGIFTYKWAQDFYLCTFKTKGWPSGTYVLTVDVAGSSYSTDIDLWGGREAVIQCDWPGGSRR